MTKERLLYIDRLKALAMILVVMGHTIYFCMYHEERPHDAIFNIICTFHVPLFFFLSGIVISKLPDYRKVCSKAYKFLKPMLIIGLINAVVIDKFRAFFLDGGHNGYWYLLTLTIFYVMLWTFNLNREKNKYISLAIDGIIALAVWLLFIFTMRIGYTAAEMFNPWAGFAFWPFFIIGVFVRKYNLLHFFTDYIWLTILLAAVYLTLVISCFSSLDHLPVVVDFLIALVAIMALVGLFHYFDHTDNWLNRQLLLIGNNTLQIYVFHYFFIRFIHLDFLIDERAEKEKEPQAKGGQQEAQAKDEHPQKEDHGESAGKKEQKVPPEIVKLIVDSVSDIADEDGYAFMGELGNLLLKKQPDFDPRNFGFTKLTPLIRSIGRFEIDARVTDATGTKHIYLRDKEA